MRDKNLSLKKIASQGTAWLTASGLIVKVIGFAYVFVVLTQLSVWEYGLVALTLSIGPLLGLFSLIGVQPVMIADLTRHYAVEEISIMRDKLSAYISLRTVLAIVAGVGLFASTYLMSHLFEPATIRMVQLMACSFFVSPLRSVLLIMFNVTSNFRGLALFKLIEELCKISLVCLLLLVYDYGAMAIIIAYVVTDYVVSLLCVPVVYVFRQRVLEGKLFSSAYRKPWSLLTQHVTWSMSHSGVVAFGKQLRPWVIQVSLGTEVVGLYAAAKGLVQHTGSFIPFARVVAPLVPQYTTDHAQLNKLVHASVRYQLVLQAAAVIVIAALLPYVLEYVFPEYVIAYPLYLGLVGLVFLEGISDIYETVFHAFQKQKDLFIASVVRLALVLTVLPLGIWWIGIGGIVLEGFLTQLVYLRGRYKILQKVVPSYRFNLRSMVVITDLDRLLWQACRGFVFKKIWRMR